MLVMKFGGASVSTAGSFAKVAKTITQKTLQGQKVAVVISAMANMTNQLFSLSRKVHPSPPKREQDMLVSVGERISISLLAMALSKQGVAAVSFTGSQSGIITCENHTDAKIVDMRPKRLRDALSKGKIAIVAGFQGVSAKGEITTLGRGGSDTSAVALGIALGASKVEFYKDVGGIYEEDPKVEPRAKVYARLSYQKALQLARGGAKVLHPRCLELAEKNGIELWVYSFQSPAKVGTIVGFNSQREKSSLSYEVVTCLQN